MSYIKKIAIRTAHRQMGKLAAAKKYKDDFDRALEEHLPGIAIREAQKEFYARWEACENELKFVPEWHNGTGYFNALSYEPLDQVSRTQDEHGRKILVFPIHKDESGVEGDNVVLFQRYPDRDHVANCMAHGLREENIKDVDELIRILVCGPEARMD